MAKRKIKARGRSIWAIVRKGGKILEVSLDRSSLYPEEMYNDTDYEEKIVRLWAGPIAYPKSPSDR